jgi:hypothetical protein
MPYALFADATREARPDGAGKHDMTVKRRGKTPIPCRDNADNNRVH